MSNLNAGSPANVYIKVGGTEYLADTIVDGDYYFKNVDGVDVLAAHISGMSADDLKTTADGIKEKITTKTKAIIVVHLYGMPAKIDEIKESDGKFKQEQRKKL